MAIDELRERLSALQHANEAPVAEVGETVWGEPEAKARYLKMLAEGKTHLEVCRELGVTGSFMRKFRSQRSPKYDPDFSLLYEEIMNRESGEHWEALVQRLRLAGITEALRGNARLIEKYSMIYDSDWEGLRPQNFQAGVNIEQLTVLLPGVSTETLNRMIEEAEAGRKALPPPDIEV